MNNQDEKYKNYYEVLELEENASLADINRSYKKLKELYSSGSIVTDPIEDEFSEEERVEIVKQIEEAYKALILYVVEKDRIQKIPPKEEVALEDTAVEEEEAPEEGVPDTKKEIEEDEEEVLLLEEELPDEESIKTMVAPPTPMTPTEPESFPEEMEEMEEDRVYVHENEHVHEPVHIELPEKDEEIQDNGFEFIPDHVEKEAIKEKAAVKDKSPIKRGVWEESLFEKDLDEIKKEITKDLTQDIQEQLTIAKEPPGKEPPPVKDRFEGIPIKGRTLKKLREKLGKGIHEIAIATRINYKILVNIEKERFSKLPDPGYLRWYLMTYAKELSLDPKRTADDYMKRYRQWEKEQKGLS